MEPTTPAVPTAPTPPPAPTPSTIAKPEIVFPEGAFYRNHPYVFKGNHLTLTAKYTPGGTPMWSSLVPEPSALQIYPGPFNATAFLRTDRLQEYRVQLGVDYGNFEATPTIAQFRVIPPQIEYVVEVANLASGDTLVTVRPGRTNAPMESCMVYTKDGCQRPAFVEVSVGNRYFGTAQQPNAAGEYVYTLKTSTLSPTELNWVRVRVSANPLPGIGIWAREVVHGFSTRDAPSAKGVLTVDTSPASWYSAVSYASSGFFNADREVGNTYTVSASQTGGSFPTVDRSHEVFRLVVKPAGSTSTFQRFTCGDCYGGTFFADKPGLYIFEYIAAYPDGTKSTPVYSVAEIFPHRSSFTAMVFNTPVPFPDYWQTPKQSPEDVRVEILPGSEQSSETRSPLPHTVELFVDGVSLGRLTQTNVTRYRSATSAYRAYGYDIPKAALGSAPHAARVVYTDTRGNVHEGTFTLIVGTDTQAGFGPFFDPNP